MNKKYCDVCEKEITNKNYYSIHFEYNPNCDDESLYRGYKKRNRENMSVEICEDCRDAIRGKCCF